MVFDSAKARIVAETFPGSAVEWLGDQRAHVVRRIVLAFAYAGGLASLLFLVDMASASSKRGWSSPVFRSMGQQSIGGERSFRVSQANRFRLNSLLFVALGFAYRSRWWRLSPRRQRISHFLVGGFWRQQRRRSFSSQQKQFKTVLLTNSQPLRLRRLDGAVAHRRGAARRGDLLTAPPSQGPSVHVIMQRSGVLNTLRRSIDMMDSSGLGCWIVAAVQLGPGAGRVQRIIFSPIGVAAMTASSFLLFALVIASSIGTITYPASFTCFARSLLTLFLSISPSWWRFGASAPTTPAVTLAAAAFIAIFAWGTVKAQVDIAREHARHPADQRELIDAIERHSSPEDIVLIEPFNEMHTGYVRLHRVIPGQTLVSWESAPTDPATSLLQRFHPGRRQGCAAPMQPPARTAVDVSTHIATDAVQCGRGDVGARRDAVDVGSMIQEECRRLGEAGASPCNGLEARKELLTINGREVAIPNPQSCSRRPAIRSHS